MSISIKGIAASPGISIAKAYRLQNQEFAAEKKNIIDAGAEIERLEEALTKSKIELEEIKDRASNVLGKEKADIFAAHLLVLSDPEFINPIKYKITSEQVNVEFALNETAGIFISMFENMDNEYMKERAADIRDVTKRVMANLLGITLEHPGMISEEVVIIAEDLTPSDTAQLNRQFVKGFTTDIGGRTSHSAIMARTLEIPAVVGTKTVTATIESGMKVIIDGLNGEVIVNPSEEIIKLYKIKKTEFETEKAN